MHATRWLVLVLAVMIGSACGGDNNAATVDAAPDMAGLGTKCDDGLDNDGDGKTDYPEDPGCVAPNADDETDDCPDGPQCPQCGNGRDDDNNGSIDFPNDPGCESAADTTEVLVSPVACGATMMIKDLPITGIDSGTLGGSGPASTSQIASPCGGGGGAAAIAYRITLTQPAVIRATTAGSTFDTVLDLRSAMCSDPAAEIACHDDVSDVITTSTLTQSLAAGVYYLIVQGADTAATGMYSLTVERFSGEGVSCTDTSECGPTLVCRTPYGGAAMVCTRPQCGDNLDDDQDGKNGYPTDPGCESPDDNDETDPSPLPACSDGIDNDDDNLTDYPMDTSCDSAAGNSEACSNEQDPIANITTGMTTGNLVGAHDDYDLACDSSVGGALDLLYTLNVPHMRTLSINTDNSTMDTVLSLLGSTCMEPNLACADEGGATSGDSLITVNNLVAGTYIVAVGNWSSSASYPPGPFNLNVSGVIMPGGSCEPSVTLGGAFACPASNPCEGAAGSMRCRPTACGDGVDNDSDTKMDFPDDPGCASLDDTDEADTCATGPGPGCPQCADGIDNDADNMVDDADPNCTYPSTASEACMTSEPITPLVLAVTAGDNTGAANDFTPACGGSTNSAGDDLYSVTVPALTDLTITVDMDNDGVVALYDPTCSGTALDCSDTPETVELGALAAGTYYFLVDGYNDASDEDAYTITVDGTIAAGESCESPLALAGALTCASGNACAGPPGSRTCQVARCNDGIDNDNPTDGKIDFPFDPGCTSPNDDDETDPGVAPVCSNNMDDDLDTTMDFPNDYGCSSAAGTTEVFCATETNPTSLITTTPTIGTTTGATDDFPTNSCAFLGNATGEDIAFGLSLPVPVASLVLSTEASAHTDTQLVVRDTQCGVEIGCDEDSAPTNANSLLTLTNIGPGNFAVIVDGYAGIDGAISLSVVGTVAPNTDCTSPLFSTGVLVCPTGTTCTGTPMRCQ